LNSRNKDNKKKKQLFFIVSLKYLKPDNRSQGRSGHDRMVVEFTTTYAIMKRFVRA
jgi:hypothetical protein